MPVNLICATRGEAGWQGKPRGAKEEDLAQIRTADAVTGPLLMHEFHLSGGDLVASGRPEACASTNDIVFSSGTNAAI